jgi:regulator of sirC expression with transglutaminase-like and TPR domain
MDNQKEILALLHLVDDPDIEVFDTVSSRLLEYGKMIVPNLEKLWETTESEDVQFRIENLIHRALFTDLQNELAVWCKEDNPSLFQGALLIAKYQYPSLDVALFVRQFEQIRRNIWLELNHYLTPLEQVNVVNSILYSYYKLTGHELTDRNPNYFYINYTMESKQGNAFTIGVLYLSLCEVLDIPVYAINLPRQFIFAYYDSFYQNQDNAHFFIDPVNGMIYSQNDVDFYLKKINKVHAENYFKPLSNKEVLGVMLEELAQAFDYRNELTKYDEIITLLSIINNQIAD